MKAIQVQAPVTAALVDVPDLIKPLENEILLRVNLVGMCGTDLTTFRGGNPMVAFPRILGHEVAATVVEGASDLPAGTKVDLAYFDFTGRKWVVLAKGHSRAGRLTLAFTPKKKGKTLLRVETKGARVLQDSSTTAKLKVT